MRAAVVGVPGSDSEVYAERAAARLGVPLIRLRTVDATGSADEIVSGISG
ncbi:hypothetical protein JCM9533A_39890 [Catenuloplanes niger JCM 9533]